MFARTSRAQPISQAYWVSLVDDFPAQPRELLARRREARHEVPAHDLRLQPGADSAEPQFDGVLLEVSCRGLTVQSQRRLPIESQVRVGLVLDDVCYELQGVVRHSSRSVLGYKTGIELNFTA